MSSYAINKRWRKLHPEKRKDGNLRYYAKTTNARNRYVKWTVSDINLVRLHTIPDSELSSIIGRSVRAIQATRCKYKDWLSHHGGRS